MTFSRTFRNWFVATLLAASVFVVLLTAGAVGRRLWPEWREQAIQQAFDESREPEFWWPKGWRVELAMRQEEREHQERLLELHLRLEQLRKQTTELLELGPAPGSTSIPWAGL